MQWQAKSFGAKKIWRIALIAHDAKKDDLVNVLSEFLPFLQRCHLLATQGTGVLCAGRLGLNMSMVNSGPLGGDQQVGAGVVVGTVDAVIFLRDPLTSQPHEPDISALLRVCDVHDVPVATNAATGRAILAQFAALASAEEDEVKGKVQLQDNTRQAMLVQKEEAGDDDDIRRLGVKGRNPQGAPVRIEAQVGRQKDCGSDAALLGNCAGLSLLLGEVGID